MGNPYFTALQTEAQLYSEKLVNDKLEPFRRYLVNAKTALEKKEVKCSWSKLTSLGAVLIPQSKVFEIKPILDIKLENVEAGWFEVIRDIDDDCELDDDFEADFDEPIVIGKGKSRVNITLAENQYRYKNSKHYIYLGTDVSESKISWIGYNLEIAPISEDLPNEFTVSQGANLFKVKKVNGQDYRAFGFVDPSLELFYEAREIKFTLLSEFSDPDNLVKIDSKLFIISNKKPTLKQADVIDVTKLYIKNLQVSDLVTSEGVEIPNHWKLVNKEAEFYLQAEGNTPQKLSHKYFNGLDFKCEFKQDNEKWIQLDYINNSQETGTERDILEFFFDGDVDILDANQRNFNNKYRILGRRPEEKQIKLGRGHTPVYPSNDHLQVRVNVSGIRSQMNAVQVLKQKPNVDNRPLLDLLLDRTTLKWPDFHWQDTENIDWKILSDPDFEGCDKQREFVAKGLNTTDFAILDGPPGTGKTTTILELIVQLVRQGKRVLLTASTHAAINNVLERVKENQLDNEIFSLRIGDEARAQGVEEFQYDNQLKELHQSTKVNSLEQLLVDSSNLVCGTTMGILRLINDKSVSLEKGYAPFDVMIIDECSKTTFAEFLVPARFAKRWILVGDIKQLSPFTDREQITANLKELILKPKTSKNKTELKLSSAVQEACFLLSSLRKNTNGQWGFLDKLIIPVSTAVLAALLREVVVRSKQDSDYSKIGLIGKDKSSDREQYFDLGKLTERPWLLYEFNLIFIDQSLFEIYQNKLPHDAVIIDDEWRKSSHCFRHQANWDNSHEIVVKRSKTLSNSSDVHSQLSYELKNNTWADEIVWRLEREYWLRFINNTGRNPAAGIKKQLEQLLPKSVNATGRIYTVRDMAFPSVLEALSGSGLLKSNKVQANTLNQGFHDNEKTFRHTTLTYQHRMHPDISSYSRKQFYSEQGKAQSLLDGSRTEREWSYKRYTKRAVWLNVNSGKLGGNKNPAEAVKIINELEIFCAWAEKQKKQYDVAILTFYKGQEAQLRSELQKLTKNKNSRSRFEYQGVQIKLNTVDYFQGQEADVVFLSMVNTERDGFMDSPNRLNVAVTRARFQLVVVGKHDYYAMKSPSPDLKALAKSLFKESK